ncbi:MAG: SpoIVB peptidase S55 domain-containing protein [Myxococcota bacterium]
MTLSATPVMPIRDVRPGQTGQCLTVFEGDEIESFSFVVKGVMNNFLGPGRDLVLIRLQGEKLEFTGVVSGMSGSPCSIDGKLLGALSYAFGIFAKEPIAGITPMDSMLDVMKLPEEKRPWRIGAAKAWSSTVFASYTSTTSTSLSDWDAFRSGTAPPVHAPTGDLRPIATPLMMGGVVPVVRNHFDPWLRAVGFEPVAGGSAAPGAKPKPFRPGSAIAAVLVRGDVDIAATGTVTSVNGDEILAFGHPFFGTGAISLPMANATIINTLVSSMRSFKMATIGAVLGEVTQDRLTAIGGRMGRFARMVPVTGSITTPKGKASFNLEVARDVGLTPRFIAIGMASALAGRVEAGSRGTLRMTGRIEAEGIDPIDLRNVYSAENDGRLFIYSAIDAAMMVDALWNSSLGPPPEIKVTVDVPYEAEPVEERVDAIFLDRKRVRAGESVEVAVRLRRRQGGTSLERFLIQVPRSWANQEVQIVASGVGGAEGLERSVVGTPRPTKLRQVGKWLSRRRADGQLYLMAVRKGVGLRAGVDMHSFLPPSVVAIMSGDGGRQRRSRGLAWEERRQRPGTVSGQARVSVKVVAR